MFVLLIISPTVLFAQSSSVATDTTYNMNFLQTDLFNDINQAVLHSKIYLNTVPLKKINVLLSADYLSNTTKLSENFNNYAVNLKFITNYILSKKTDIGLGTYSRIMADDRSVELNKLKSNFYFINFDYVPQYNIKLNARTGIKTEDQIGRFNSGFSGMLLTEIDKLTFNSYNLNATADLNNDALQERKSYQYRLNASLSKKFSPASDNIAIVKAYTTKSDFYVPSTPSIISQYGEPLNIQSRKENYIYLQDELTYKFTNFLTTRGNAAFLTKNYYNEFKYKPTDNNAIFENVYDTKVVENRIEIYGTAEIDFRKFRSDIKLLYSERSETHNLINSENILPTQQTEINKIEQNKNNIGKITSLSMNSFLSLSNTHSIKFSGSSTILRYDTDSKENYDDRDELYIILQVSHNYTNLDNFNVETTFEFNSSDYNYLFKERSANNNTNKLYRLTSTSFYKPIGFLSTKNSAQVLANYTVYKFEDLTSQIQSYVYRQILIWDTTVYNLNKNLYFNLNGQIKNYEQGQYNDAQFSIRPVNYYSERLINLNINFTKNFYTISSGYRYFIQQQYIYEDGEKNIRNTTRSYGPYVSVLLRFREQARVYIYYGRDRFTSTGSSASNSSNNLSINAFWNI
jgi:hypothetical protein